jgi:amphi-Trp domain-containing protein
MSEETLYAFEQTQSRGEIAADLRSLATQLDGGGLVTFAGEEQTVAVTPPERPTFEIEVERERRMTERPAT